MTSAVLVLFAVVQTLPLAVSPMEALRQPPGQDRAAILALAGEFVVHFDFQETISLQAGYTLDEPYQSRAFEWVVVLADEPDFISLQHVLMVGTRAIKHWRQDWRYEQRVRWDYAGLDAFDVVHASARDVAGTWTQTVYQTDDCPRYTVVGAWVHESGTSTFTGPASFRPLPRRELDRRKDYHAMRTTHRITVTPVGWSHEQDSDKLRLVAGRPVLLCREAGLNMYTRTEKRDFSAARALWAEQSAFWEPVRAAWDRRLLEGRALLIREQIGEVSRMRRFAELASTPAERREADAVERLLGEFVSVAPAGFRSMLGGAVGQQGVAATQPVAVRPVD